MLICRIVSQSAIVYNSWVVGPQAEDLSLHRLPSQLAELESLNEAPEQAMVRRMTQWMGYPEIDIMVSGVSP